MDENEILERVREIWRGAREPGMWAGDTEPRETLIWKDGHPRQVKDLLAVAHLMGLDVRVAGRHRSKSVDLPVGVFHANIWNEEDVYFFTRDNFHDYKIVVCSSVPIEHLPYETVHRPMTAEELFEEKMRCYNYCKPKDERQNPYSKWDPASFDSDAWFDDWCHDTLLRVDDRIYRCGTTSPVYYEGIDDILPREVFVRYEHGQSCFAAEVPRGGVVGWQQIMRAVVRSAQCFVQDRRTRAHDIERLAQYEADVAAGKELTEWHLKNKAELEVRLRETPA